jgi:DNA (cytosine-5)-methyltransferase 1
MKLRTLDLFSGIGGFSLGLESTGFFETIGFVEKDKFCQKVLKKHWSNINIEEDIRNVKGEKYQADVVTGGFPCQPFSVAGKRKSTADDRYLWDEMLRVIRETKPRWVIGENVEGIVNINEGMVLRQVLNDLENEGFKSQCIIIPASGIGAWHQRKRIWILAYSNSNGSYRSQGNATKQSSNKQKDRLSFRDDKDVPNSESSRCGRWSCKKCSVGEWSFLPREQEGCKMGSEVEGCSRDVPNSDKRDVQTGCKRQWGICEEHKRKGTSNNATSIYETLSNTNDKGLQGFNSEQFISEQELRFSSNKNDEGRKTWWQTQSELCGTVDGLSYELDKDRSNRIKALGNSIVPQIARQIGLSIMEAEIGN